MKRFLIYAAFFLTATGSVVGQNLSLTAMTYNLRYDEPRDGDDTWVLRKAELAAQIKQYRPDLLGIQEGLARQVFWLDSCLTNHSWVGSGRDDGKLLGEMSALYFDTTRLELITSGTFWLSPTPDVPSKGWDASLPRVCTYALVRYRDNGRSFWAFNTHFDHMGLKARQNSAKLIFRQIKKFNKQGYPVILMGDFNCTPVEKPAKYLASKMTDTWTRRHIEVKSPHGTFNGFGRDTTDRRIDYIFVRGFKVADYKKPSEVRANGRFISDHFPVVARLDFK